MPRPNKPHWHAPRSRWRTRIDGKYHYFPRTIGRHDKPLVAQIPQAAWDHMNALLRMREGQGVSDAEQTVGWLAELYLQWCEGERDAGRLSPGQYDGHVTRVGKFVAFPHGDGGGTAGAVRARDIPPELLDDFFDAMRDAGYSDHYVANLGKSVRAMFNWSSRRVKDRTPPKILATNPVSGYQFPRSPGAVRGYVDGQVVRRFIRWAWGRSRRVEPHLLSRRFNRLYLLMVWFQRLTGCRPGEACGLQWADVDWDAGRIVIPKERHKTGKKTNRDRIIHLTPPVVRLLRVIERLPGRHAAYVFTHKRGNHAVDRGQGDSLAGEPWPSGSAAADKITNWRRQAIAEGVRGVQDVGPKKFVAYVNRHAYVSDAVSSGLTHEQTANLVGNTAAVVATTYAHAIEQKDAERARALARRGRGGRG